eukprot:2130530-Prymnesium_polylepis.1
MVPASATSTAQNWPFDSSAADCRHRRRARERGKQRQRQGIGFLAVVQFRADHAAGAAVRRSSQQAVVPAESSFQS